MDSAKVAYFLGEQQNIEITRYTIRFGTNVYQLKNVTGFNFGPIPAKIPIGMILISLAIGLIGVLALIPPDGRAGAFLLLALSGCLLVYALVFYLSQLDRYGLNLALNSGKEIYFICRDLSFLRDTVDTLYDFMEDGRFESVVIDMSNKSIKVGGDFYGNAITGDNSETYYQAKKQLD